MALARNPEQTAPPAGLARGRALRHNAAMPGYLNQILLSQFEAALCMLRSCIAACPEEHWEGKIAQGTFRWVAYHTLFFADVYLSRGEKDFTPRELHKIGGDELQPFPAPGLSREQSLEYAAIVRQKAIEMIGADTAETLEADCGFSWRKFSRGEMHIYNIRHIQHHAGQLSAYLRRVDDRYKDRKSLPWIGAGWKEAALT